MKTITILGGNGYVGRKCVKRLLLNDSNAVVNVISRRGLDLEKLELGKEYFSRINNVIADSLNPEDYKDVLLSSTGVIHSIGALMTLADKNSKNSYEMKNKQSALRPAKFINDNSQLEKINFVYISAQRGITFPLSLLFKGYIETKRETENELKKLNRLSVTILKPGIIKDKLTRPEVTPLYNIVNITSKIEKTYLNKVCSNIGESLQLPSEGTELEVLAEVAALSALGLVERKEFSSLDLQEYKLGDK